MIPRKLARSFPGRRPSAIDSTNSASSRRPSLTRSPVLSSAQQVRQVTVLRSAPISVMGTSLRGRVPHATSPASVAAWTAAYRPPLTLTTFTYSIGRPLGAMNTLLACSSVIARDGRPGRPLGRSTNPTTLRPMRSYFWARRIDLVSVLLIFTREALLSVRAALWKKRSASTALKSFSFVVPIVAPAFAEVSGGNGVSVGNRASCRR